MKATQLKLIHPRWMVIVYNSSKIRKDPGYGRKIGLYVEVHYFYNYKYAVQYMNYKVAEGYKATLQALCI